MRERREASHVIDPPTGARLRHYLMAMLLVGCALAGAVRVLDRATEADVPSAVQDALLIDLPPLEAGARPQGDDAPTQQAAPDAAGAVAPPKPQDDVAPLKRAVVAIPKAAPPRQPASASAAQARHEAGAARDAKADSTEADDPETRRASAHQITLWQKAMMARLQAARRVLPHRDRPRGLAKIAFEIDREGRLVSERVAIGSGSSALDAAALALVRLAAPYPSPPRDAGTAELSFVVPISFRP